MLFTEQEKRDIISGMQMMHRQQIAHKKKIEVAKNRFELFKIYVNAGFTEKQALQLLIADMENQIKYKKELLK